jgi:predicted HTH domain antitoxin
MMWLVSLQKASEILNIEPDAFLKILDLMNIEFSFLAGNDIQTERIGLKPQL